MSFFSFNLALNVIGIVTKSKEVAIFDGTREVLSGDFIQNTTILDCRVIDDSQICNHPIESGALIADHKIFNPIEIDIRLSADNVIYNDVYEQLNTLYESNTPLRIKTRAGWYENMILQAIPHEETPDRFDNIIFNLHFVEVWEVPPKYIKLPVAKVKNIMDSDTVNLGNNVTGNTTKKSILKNGLNSIIDKFKGRG